MGNRAYTLVMLAAMLVVVYTRGARYKVFSRFRRAGGTPRGRRARLLTVLGGILSIGFCLGEMMSWGFWGRPLPNPGLGPWILSIPVIGVVLAIVGIVMLESAPTAQVHHDAPK